MATKRTTSRLLSQHGWLLALLLWGLVASAQAATAVCDFATGQGATGPADFARYCWIDFGNYNETQAKSGAGQNFTVSLPSGTLSFNLKVAGGSLTSATAPVWGGAAFGQSAFTGIPGTPTLYQAANSSTTTVTLSNIVVATSGGDLPYTFVAADAEASNNGESLSFAQSGGNNWYQLAQMPNGSSTTYPGVSGLGTATVTETGVAGTVGAYAFASDFPANGTISSVTTTIVGGGLQGAAFGIKYHSADLAISSTHSPANFVPGANGSYTLTVHNNGPEKNTWAPGDTTTVTDTLPTGLTYVPTGSGGSGWTCSASGQVVTCTSSANVNSGADMAAITINVAVTSNVTSLPADVTNSASVASVYDYDSSNNNVNDVTPIVHSSLTTSTKGVVDANGGDLEPGDTLQYTVILTESNGVAATGVSLLDNMDTEIAAGSLAVTTTPSGSTDSSNANGGTNNTGQVSISNISVPANSSVSVVYTVQVSNAANNGQSVDNTATITNPDTNGVGASPSVSMTINQSQVPSSGNKILYLHNSDSDGDGSDDLNRTPPTGTGGGVTIQDNNNYNLWALTPVLQKALTIDANSTASVTLLVECTSKNGGGTCRSGNQLHWIAQLYDYDGSYTQIGSNSPTASFNHPNYTPVTANIDIGASAYTVAAGHRLVLAIWNTTNNNNRPMRVEQYSGGDRSRINLGVSTVINVDSVTPFAAAYPATTQTSPYSPNNTVYIRAVISDPFGSYDINPATGGVAPSITIKDGNGTPIDLNGAASGNAANMTEVANSNAASKTFEYQYALPNMLAAGFWTASITATEGQAAVDYLYNGNNTITHTGNGAFAVQAPNLMLMKSVMVLSDPTGSATPHALPGALLQYSINVSNQGQGAVDVDTVKLADTLDANTAFMVGSASFVDGSPVSGLTFNSASDVEYCTGAGGSSCPYTSLITSGNPDPAITKVIFTPSGILNGKASPTATAPSFTIRYQVKLQ